MREILKLHNASFSRKQTKGTREILSNISIALNEGEILSVLGRNGVGKTTFIKCLLGLLEWNQGEMTFMDKPFLHYSHKELWNLISYVPQAKHNILHINVLDMVALGLNPLIHLKPNKAHLQKAKESLERLHISHLAKSSCCNLSGGELQMVLFARALVSSPKLLVLDEPESNLDFANQKIIIELLKSLANEGCGIILNTHFPAHARYLSHKALLLKPLDSNLESNGTFGHASQILTKHNLSELYGVELELAPITCNANGFVAYI